MKKNNFVIKALTREHGRRIVKYFKSLGHDTGDKVGDACEQNKSVCPYYGVINKKFNNYSLEEVLSNCVTIGKLPVEPKTGDYIYVSNEPINLKNWDKEKKDRLRRIYVTTIEGSRFPVITVDKAWEEEFINGNIFETTKWKYMQPVPEEEGTERKYTIEELAKETGLSVKSIKKLLE